MSNIKFSKEEINIGGAMAAMNLSSRKVIITGAGEPWTKSKGKTVLIQDETGAQYRLGVKFAVPAITQQMSATCAIMKTTADGVEFIPNVEFMFASDDKGMTFVELKAATPAVKKK